MRHNNDTTPKIRRPEDFLTIIPHLLGFQPDDCAVTLIIRDGMLYCTARCDLDALFEPGGPAWYTARFSVPPPLGPAGEPQLFLVGYGPRQRVSTALHAVWDEVGPLVLDALVVQEDRWWFLDEPDSAEGRPLPDPGTGPRQITQRPVAARRTQLADDIAAPTGEREDQMTAALMEGLDQLPDDPATAGRWVLDTMNAWVKGAELSDSALIAAGASMVWGPARDQLWTRLTPPMARRWLPFWKEVLRRTPRGSRAVPLSVAGVIAWVAGEGALMNICLVEAQAEDPQFTVVDLLSLISDNGLPPSTWEMVRNADVGELATTGRGAARVKPAPRRSRPRAPRAASQSWTPTT
jgi:hypothetical protein